MAAAAPVQIAISASEQLATPGIATPGPATPGIDTIVRHGLSLTPKQLPPWLFYDEAGSLLFEQITCLPEYYLTRLERSLFAECATEMIAAAAGGETLRLVELGAGSADKTRMLLAATLCQQDTLEYQPVDVSETALAAAAERLAIELPAVVTNPLVADYTASWVPDAATNVRTLLLWIGSSIGNFEPDAALNMLRRINQSMRSGDSLLLGVDLAPFAGGKCIRDLEAAYDDAAQVTACFNRNLLVRLNRELGSDFDPEAFAHCAVWNEAASRMEMHLESRRDQWIRIEALESSFHFAAGERLHTENSYKYTPQRIQTLLADAGFPVAGQWQDCDGWFAVLLGRKA
jgi:L-histidine Nalpha-methyltransferase